MSQKRRNTLEKSYIERFVTFLGEHTWHSSLTPMLTSFLDGNHDENAIDRLITAVTKKIETVLRDSIKEYQGSARESDLVGTALLNQAVDCHLIESKEEPLYHTIYWVLKKPRNTSHHRFKMYPLKQLELILLQADEAIDELRNRIRPEYDAASHIVIDPQETTIKIKAKVFSPTKKVVPDEQKVEANLQFSNGRVVPLELRPQQDGYRHNEYDYRGNSAGTLTVAYSVLEGSKRSFVQVNSTLVIPWTSAICSKCGKEIQWGQGRCSNCGETLYV
jgi:hypothetical protein